MDKIAINWAERHLCCCCKRQAYLERVTARDLKKSSRLGPRKLCSRLKKGHVSEPVPSASCQTVTSPALRSHSSLPVHRPCSPSPICGRRLRPLRIQPQRRRDLPPWRKSCGRRRRRSPPSAVQPQRATRGRRGAPPLVRCTATRAPLRLPIQLQRHRGLPPAPVVGCLADRANRGGSGPQCKLLRSVGSASGG
jgi:hypothetical protein